MGIVLGILGLVLGLGGITPWIVPGIIPGTVGKKEKPGPKNVPKPELPKRKTNASIGTKKTGMGKPKKQSRGRR